jgi:thymidylate synthase (FAD)
MKKSVDLYDDGVGFVELVDHMGNDLTIVNAARVSFGKHKTELEEADKKLINYLAKHRHTSTFEHNIATFRFKVPLFVRSQHHRHRTWSFNEISRRYTSFKIDFYQPEKYRTQHTSNRQASNPAELINPDLKRDIRPTYASDIVKQHNRQSLQLYSRLISAGVCREQARGVLPQNMYTEYYGTCNLNNLIKFINLRMHDGAQWEIQKVASATLEIAKDLWPVATEAYINARSEEK